MYLCTLRYPVHPSHEFLSAPTLAGTLYLLLVRFSNRQYADAVAMSTAVASDTMLSPEEQQVHTFPSHVQARTDTHVWCSTCTRKMQQSA